MPSPQLPALEPRPFFGRIESLRGLGALAVAAYHISGWELHGVPLLPETAWPGVDRFQNAVRWAGLAFLPAHAAVLAFLLKAADRATVRHAGTGVVVHADVAAGFNAMIAASVKELAASTK